MKVKFNEVEFVISAPDSDFIELRRILDFIRGIAEIPKSCEYIFIDNKGGYATLFKHYIITTFSVQREELIGFSNYLPFKVYDITDKMGSIHLSRNGIRCIEL